MNTHQMERYSFLWSEVRLVVAAIALFLGGVPLIWAIAPSLALVGTIHMLLGLCWIVSGVAAAFLLYRWFKDGQKVFGGKNATDVAAFFVSVVSGLNLGVAGLTGANPGMSIVYNRLVFIIVGIIYLGSAWHLWRRWKAHGERIVSGGAA